MSWWYRTPTWLTPRARLREETYVVMPGRRYPGMTADRTMERTTIRHIAATLVPKLARLRYTPGTSAATADLLLVLHWGTTIPRGCVA